MKACIYAYVKLGGSILLIWMAGGALAVLAIFAEKRIDAQAQTVEMVAEKTVTITEKQLDVLVSQRIAQSMIAEEKSLNDQIVEPRNWHTAIFDGVIYHIYTGPGQLQARSWYQKVEVPPKKTKVDK